MYIPLCLATEDFGVRICNLFNKMVAICNKLAQVIVRAWRLRIQAHVMYETAICLWNGNKAISYNRQRPCRMQAGSVHCQCQVQRSPFETCGRGPVSFKHRDSRHGGETSQFANEFVSFFVRAGDDGMQVCLVRWGVSIDVHQGIKPRWEANRSRARSEDRRCFSQRHTSDY